MSVLLCVSPCCALPGIHTADCDDPDCRGCMPARAADGLYLCPRCTAQLGRDAMRAAQLHAALGLVLAGGSTGDRGPGGRSAGLDLNDAAVEARAAIRTVLVGLCRIVAEERGIALPADTVVAMAAYVARHAQWLAAHAAAGEHARDLRDVATDGRSWRVAYAVSGDRTLVGVCNQAGTAADGDPGAVCGALIWHRPSPESHDGPEIATDPIITCDGCGTTGTVLWWRWELCSAADGDEVVDAYAAAAYLSSRWLRPVQPGLVWQWGRRYADAGLVREVVTGPDGPVEGRPLRDKGGRVLFVLGMLEQRAVKMWGPAPELANVGGLSA